MHRPVTADAPVQDAPPGDPNGTDPDLLHLPEYTVTSDFTDRNNYYAVPPGHAVLLACLGCGLVIMDDPLAMHLHNLMHDQFDLDRVTLVTCDRCGNRFSPDPKHPAHPAVHSCVTG